MRPITPLLALAFLSSSAAQTCPQQNQVSLVVRGSLLPSLPGQAVTITAYITPVLGIADPTGSLQFFEGLTDLGTLPIQNGQASITRTLNDAGAHIFHVI